MLKAINADAVIPSAAWDLLFSRATPFGVADDHRHRFHAALTARSRTDTAQGLPPAEQKRKLAGFGDAGGGSAGRPRFAASCAASPGVSGARR
jgi:hypothetical protein